MFNPIQFLKNYKSKRNQKGYRKYKSIRYDSDEAVKSALLEFCTYLVFLVVTTIVSNTSHNVYMFYFNRTLEKLFILRETQTGIGLDINFEDMATTSDWWHFLQENFLDDIHGEVIEAANATNRHHPKKDDSLDRTVLRDNILLGPPRLRQIRVRDNTCEIHKAFATYFNSCYGEYSQDNEDRHPEYLGAKFYTMNQLNVVPIRGEIKYYYGAGYVTNLSYERDKNEEIIETLKESKWIDRATRVIALEFVLYNSNSMIFDNLKIIIELPPVGGIITSYQFQAVKLHSMWSDMDVIHFLATSIFCLMVLFYTMVEVRELLEIGIVEYLKSLWNIIDFMVLVIAYISLVYNTLHPKYVNEVLKRSKDNPLEFQSIDKICYWNLLYIDVMGVCVFLVWIKVFKYISFNKTMMQFSLTLSRCAKDLFGFAVMFFIVFLAYAQLGLLIFGSRHPDFRTFGTSVITLMRMFLGDFEYQLIEMANHFLGPIYFLTYVLFVFFILLNMFLAIINDTYGIVKNEVSQGRFELGSYVMKLILPYIRCQSLSKYFKRNNRNAMDNVMKSEAEARDPSVGSGNDENDGLRKRVSELIRDYFEELPPNEYPNVGKNTREYNSIKRLTNRITLLEDVLEQLITDMDRILVKIESKQQRKQRKRKT